MAKGRRSIANVSVEVPLGELARARHTLMRMLSSPAQPALLSVVYRLRLMLQAVARHVDGESAYNAEVNVLTKLHGKEDPAAGQPGAFEFNPEGLRAYTKARAELDEEMQTLAVPVIYLSEVMEIRLAPPLTNDEYLTLMYLMDEAPPAAAPEPGPTVRGDEPPAAAV